MTQLFEDIEATQTLKTSRPDLLDRDDSARTMNSGTTLPVVDDANYANMIGMVVFKTDELVNRQLTEYDTDTDIATWIPMVSGPISSTDGNIAVFDGLSGGKIKDTGKAIPAGDIAGTTDTQTLANKTLTNLAATLPIAEGGTGGTTKLSAFDNLSPTTTKGDLIANSGVFNGRVAIGTDTQILTANSGATLGVEWSDPGGGGAGGLTLQVETADFTAEKDKLHYITATGPINVKLPVATALGDRFGIITGASDNVSIYTNENAAAQSLIAAGGFYSTASSNSSIRCGAIGEKMIYAEFSATCFTEFIAYVNYVTVVSTQGYLAGGTISSVVSIIDNLDFKTEACSALSATLTAARSSLVGANSLTNAYFAGGSSGSALNKIDKLSFSDELCVSLLAVISSARSNLAGANSASSAYFAGGTTTSAVNTIDRLVFLPETCSSISSTLSSVRSNLAGANSSVNAYFVGGLSGSAVNTIDRLLFSSETCGSISATLSSNIYNLVGANSPTKAYFAGGYVSSPVNTIDALVFSSETCSSISSTLTLPNRGMAGCESSTKSYFGGGYTTALTDSINALIFSDETCSSISATISSSRWFLAGANN